MKIKKILVDKKNLIIIFLSSVIILLLAFMLTESIDTLKPTESKPDTPRIISTEEMRKSCDICIEPELDPYIWYSNLKLTTPLMSKYSKNDTPQKINIFGGNYTIPFRIEFNIFHGWEYKNYYFPYSLNSGSVTTYFVSISYMEDPRYNLSFKTLESEFGHCDFDNSYPDDSNFQINVLEYQTVYADFGELRIGRADSEKNLIVVCQKNVSGFESQTSDWADITNIGVIGIQIPEDSDPDLYNDILEIIKRIKVIEYLPKNDSPQSLLGLATGSWQSSFRVGWELVGTSFGKLMSRWPELCIGS